VQSFPELSTFASQAVLSVKKLSASPTELNTLKIVTSELPVFVSLSFRCVFTPLTKVRVLGKSDSGPVEFSGGLDGFRVAEQNGQLLELSAQGIGPSTKISANATTIPGTVTAVIFDRFR
jgi:hypothetical protein